MGNKLDGQYKELIDHILHFGVEKKDRTGTGTKSIFGWQIRHKMSDGFPLLTTKKMYFKGIVTELLWFLRGDTSIEYLLKNDCNIWTGDAYKKYEQRYHYSSNAISYKDGNPENGPWDKENFIRLIKEDTWFASMYGNLGPIYGHQWRRCEFGEDKAFKNGKTYRSGEFMYDIKKESIDQIANIINDLKTNPDSRRMMVNSWNVGQLSEMILPPCHHSFQVYTRELNRSELNILYNKKRGVGEVDTNYSIGTVTAKDPNIPRRAISLMFNMRSTDVGLGLGFNLASYGLLLMMIAKQVNMIPDELVYNGGDVHLYSNHIEPIKEQLTRQPYELPTVKLSDRIVSDISEYTLDDIILENYNCHSTIKMPLSN